VIVKRIALQNIRSYREATVDLALGRTLFEGDIGSGKSTLLMAIEFALFGLGSERGASLLRSTEERGMVDLVFEVEGVEYSVRRNLLRKAGRVQQTDGELRTPQGVESLSPKDLKERMLQVLGFEEPPDPKAQSVIYRYAVYTPQEEMKAILFMDPDLRLQTLRRAFGIEDYKTAKENGLELSRRVLDRAKELEASAGDLPSLRERIGERAARLETRKAEAASAASQIGSEEKALAGLKDELEALRQGEKDLAAARQQVALLEGFLGSRSREVGALRREVEASELRAARLRRQVADEEKVDDPSPRTEDELAEEVGRLESHRTELERLQERDSVKIEDYRAILQTGSCPTCDREADAAEFVEKERLKTEERDRHTSALVSHKKALAETRRLLEEKRRYEAVAVRLGEHREGLAEAERGLGEARAKEARARSELEETEDGLFKAKKEVEQLAGVSGRIGRLGAEIEGAERKLRSLRTVADRALGDVENLRREIVEDGERVAAKEAAKRRASILREHCAWIDGYFVPSLEAIERQVLTSINQDFNSHLQDWFSTLVDDQGKEARADEDFTPVVEQDGYEQEVLYLSGGEKASLALAYRLALNGIVRRVSTGMRSNLLILDEPTDGFSREQLGKMREILDEVESPQVIIVSHDKELESFADQIYRVVKDRSGSTVVVASR